MCESQHERAKEEQARPKTDTPSLTFLLCMGAWQSSRRKRHACPHLGHVFEVAPCSAKVVEFVLDARYGEQEAVQEAIAAGVQARKRDWNW